VLADVFATTNCGPVRGSLTGDLASFLSIPYAEPPVGKFRWQPAQPNTCWSGTYDATSYGPICYQFNLDTKRQQSEDCLTLDVHTRFLNHPHNKTVPVIFWIYGGSNVVGYTNYYTNLQYIAEAHDVIVVSVSYRLNAFGWTAIDVLSKNDKRGVSGNYGITDLQLALQWVQDNIASFGGDKKKVTLLGQSSGGTNILALLASPSSKGLFHGAISLSASPNITMNLHDAEKQNELLVKNWGCSNVPNKLECLYKLTPEQLLAGYPASYNVAPVFPTSPNGQNYPGLVIVDGVTVAHPIFDAVKLRLIDVPLIIQTLEAEMDLFPSDEIEAMTTSQYENYVVSTLTSEGWSSAAAKTVNELYSKELRNSSQLTFQAFISDVGFTCGCLEFSIVAGQHLSSSVYAGLVVNPPSHPFPTLNPKLPSRFPFHMWDYIAVFRAWTIFDTSYTPSNEDLDFGDYLRAQWVDFATHGVAGHNWRPVNSIEGFPNNYVVGVLERHVEVNVANLYQKRCATMKHSPLNLDERFWCTN